MRSEEEMSGIRRVERRKERRRTGAVERREEKKGHEKL